MNGNSNPYDPTQTFNDWIRKSGEAQAEFIKSFGSLMSSSDGAATGSDSGAFDPLETLRRISRFAQDTQSHMVQNAASMQSRGTDALMGMLPSMTGWGAYKTAVSSNGRISIPEAERKALGISEGDLVQVIILPIPNREKIKGGE